MIIFIFGDSITQGYWDTEGGWADRIRAQVMKRDIDKNLKYYHGIHNLGIDGNTTQQVIDRFNNEVEARLWPETDYGFIFAIGTNDTVHQNGVNDKTNPDSYSEQIKILYQKASQYTSNIAFVNLLPVNENLTNPLPASSTGKCYTNDQVKQFNSRLESVCKEADIKLVDVRTKYLEADYKTLFEDGLHPNHKGHTLIFDTLFPIVESWLYSKS